MSVPLLASSSSVIGLPGAAATRCRRADAALHALGHALRFPPSLRASAAHELISLRLRSMTFIAASWREGAARRLVSATL